MCYLSDTDLVTLVRRGLVRPCDIDNAVQPYSVDLHLGDSVFSEQLPRSARWIGKQQGDNSPWNIHSFTNQGDIFILSPGQFVLASTIEVVHMPPQYLGRVEGVSSNARIGLAVEQAGVIEGGFHGTLTLELYNMSHHNLILSPRCRIAHLLVATGLTAPTHPYGDPRRRSRYQGQQGPTPARPQPPKELPREPSS